MTLLSRLCLALVLALSCATVAQAQDDRLVAMLRIYVEDQLDRVGAAILVGQDDRGLVLATAAHTVENLFLGEGDRIEVEFLAEAQVLFEAEIAGAWPEQDLAALTVALPAGSPARRDFEAARATLLPEGLDPEEGDALFSIGFPGERAWFGNRRADILRGLEGEAIIFESTVTVPGMSGGALFGEHGALLGMVQNVSRTQARALSIDAIRNRVREAGLPFQLTESAEALPNILASWSGAAPVPTRWPARSRSICPCSRTCISTGRRVSGL